MGYEACTFTRCIPERGIWTRREQLTAVATWCSTATLCHEGWRHYGTWRRLLPLGCCCRGSSPAVMPARQGVGGRLILLQAGLGALDRQAEQNARRVHLAGKLSFVAR